MSLYREAGRGSTRTLVIAAVIALIVGLGIGFAIGRSSAPEPSGAEVVSQLRADLRPVKGGLALIPNEYAQAYRNEGVEAKGVQGTVERIKAQLAKAHDDLQTLDPSGTKELDTAINALADAVAQKADPSEVATKAREATAALQAVPGG